MSKRRLSVPEQHQLRIAKQTLKMADAAVGVMGGPNKEEARAIIRRLTGKEPKENPVRKYGSRAKYTHTRLGSPSKFDPRSFRTISTGRRGRKVVIGCPKGRWSAMTRRCSVGTRAQALLRPKRGKILRMPRRKHSRFSLAANSGRSRRRHRNSGMFFKLRPKKAIRTKNPKRRWGKWLWIAGGLGVAVLLYTKFLKPAPAAVYSA